MIDKMMVVIIERSNIGVVVSYEKKEIENKVVIQKKEMRVE
jgi:hypothetical protein